MAINSKKSAENYNWYIETDLSKYSGKWVAIVDKQVVASYDDLGRLLKEVTTKFSSHKVSLAHIPGDETLIYAAV